MIITLIFRSLIIYVLLLFLLRLMGKKQISQMQPFELVITLIFADLSTIPMSDLSLPLLHGIVPLLTLVVIEFILSFLSQKFIIMHKFINGKPIMIITPDGIDIKALKKLGISYNDLQELIREKDYFNFEDILYAIMQTNGTLTILENPKNKNQNNNNKNYLPIIIVNNGKTVKSNLELACINLKFILKELKEFNISNLKNISLITLQKNGLMYIQPKNRHYIMKKSSYNGENKW